MSDLDSSADAVPADEASRSGENDAFAQARRLPIWERADELKQLISESESAGGKCDVM